MSQYNTILTGEQLIQNWLEFISNKLNESIKSSKASDLLFENKISGKEWLTTREAASYLGRSPGAIRNMVLRGQLMPKKFAGRLLYNRRELDRAIDASK